MFSPILIVGAHCWDIEKGRATQIGMLEAILRSNVVVYVEKDKRKIIKNRFGNQDIEFTDLSELKRISEIPNHYLEVIEDYL